MSELFSTSNVGIVINTRLANLEAAVATKIPLAGGTLTGGITAPSLTVSGAAAFNGTLQLSGQPVATQVYVASAVSGLAPIASPAFTGNGSITGNLMVGGPTNTLSVGDASFAFGLSSGNPIALFDAGDFIKYDRTNNVFQFLIGSGEVAHIDSSGLINATTLAIDSQFFLVKSGASPRIQFDANDSIAYDRSGNVMTINIGGTPIFTVSAGSVSIALSALPTYADNTAATTGGLSLGGLYRTSTGQLMVRY